MFELAALGLLQREPLHGYRLKQQLEMFMSSCISVNYGTIYPLLKRLEEREAIVVVGDGASNRKMYGLTDQGRVLWLKKMMEHPQESWVNARSRFMIKLFFFSYLEPEQRLELLELRLRACQLRLAEQETMPGPEDCYQSYLWNHCSTVLGGEIAWLERILQQEQENQGLVTLSMS